MHSLRSVTKSVLNLVGLLEPARSVRRWFAEQRFRRYYSQRDLYEVQIYGREIVFSTEDGYSGRWFFPRYDGSIHDPKTTELLARLSQEAENIIDVGANLGWFSCIAASISNGTVHAFEMDEDNLHRLNTNVALNELQNVSVNHAAVANSEGHVSYWKKPESAGVAHSFARDSENEQERVWVEATTLDRYTEDHCQSVELIKIDVEGAAQKVLEGDNGPYEKTTPIFSLKSILSYSNLREPWSKPFSVSYLTPTESTMWRVSVGAIKKSTASALTLRSSPQTMFRCCMESPLIVH